MQKCLFLYGDYKNFVYLSNFFYFLFIVEIFHFPHWRLQKLKLKRVFRYRMNQISFPEHYLPSVDPRNSKNYFFFTSIFAFSCFSLYQADVSFGSIHSSSLSSLSLSESVSSMATRRARIDATSWRFDCFCWRMSSRSCSTFRSFIPGRRFEKVRKGEKNFEVFLTISDLFHQVTLVLPTAWDACCLRFHFAQWNSWNQWKYSRNCLENTDVTYRFQFVSADPRGCCSAWWYLRAWWIHLTGFHWALEVVAPSKIERYLWEIKKIRGF